MSTSIVTDTQDASVTPLRMPRAGGLPDPAPEDGRNPMFNMLVKGEGDVAGLLAYALYKQNKRQWLAAFAEVLGREPNAAETAAFILGERLPHRVETYRLLAEEKLKAMIAPERRRPAPERAADDPAPGIPATQGGAPPAAPTAADAMRRISWRQLGLLLLLVVGMAGVFRLLGAWLFRP